MKISIKIDCSPQEVREVLGLPDFAPMQREWLEKTREAMIGDPGSFDANTLIANWIKASGGGAEILPEIFSAFMPGANSKKS